MSETVSRRTVLAAGATGVAATSGCLGALTGGGGPEERSITLAISGSMSEPSVAITPEPAVEGVVTVGVGDAVTLEFANELDSDFGVHNHVTDGETVVEAGGTATESFDVTEAMVGRHELEGFSPGEHSEGTETHEGEHGDEMGTETGTHEGGDQSEEEGEHVGEVTLVVVEVRPG